jgi:hypothetical protein
LISFIFLSAKKGEQESRYSNAEDEYPENPGAAVITSSSSPLLAVSAVALGTVFRMMRLKSV